MKINSISRMYAETGKSDTEWMSDSKSKEVQNQIDNAKNQLKELSSNQELNEEEKEKKQQEIKKQLTELNNELRQRRMELQREQQEKRKDVLKAAEEEESVKTEKEEQIKPEFTQTGMKAIISAGSAINHAQTHGNMASAMDGRVRILEGEIRQDEERGKDTTGKQKELKGLEKKASKLHNAKMGYLSDATKEMRKAAKAEQQKDAAKNGKKNSDGVVRAAKPAADFGLRNQNNSYFKGNMFSNVEFYF